MSSIMRTNGTMITWNGIISAAQAGEVRPVADPRTQLGEGVAGHEPDSSSTATLPTVTIVELIM